MPVQTRIKVFISHCWNYNNHYETILNWLKNSSASNFSDYSVSQDNAFEIMPKKELQSEIEEQIRQCSIVIAPTGVYMSHSEWVKFEINTAMKHNKTILAVEPWGQQNHSLLITNVATKTVGWNSNSVINAVKELC